MNANSLTPTILIVEDEEAILTMLRYNLERRGFTVHSTTDGEEAIYLVKEVRPDIILLDWMLPGLSGIEICSRLRSNDDTKSIPIIMLTAKGEENDRVHGLDSGADDYIIKPFSPNELVARIHAVFRRIRPVFTEKTLEFDTVKMDLAAFRVTRNGQEIHLGPTEFRILQCLMEYPSRIFSREQIMSQVWGYDTYVEPRTVDVHINRLRNALKTTEDQPFIQTIRSVGYCLKRPSEG